MTSWIMKAKTYFERAEEIRTLAEAMNSPLTRAMALRIADEYEDLANAAARLAEEQHGRTSRPPDKGN
jgi:hypothetical protein